jgi:hypothetical protein
MTLEAFENAVHTSAGREPIPVRVIAKHPDTVVGFGETRIHSETARLRAARERGREPAPG